MSCSSLKSFPIAFQLRAGYKASYSQKTRIWGLSRSCRYLHSAQSSSTNTDDGRARLSKLWAPSGGLAPSAGEDSHSLLVRAGFVRQAHSGIFHMLPLGRRVQNKLEALIDKHMSTLDASKVDLSSISSEALWAASGRLEAIGSELFRFQDRKEAGYLLSPTHEEEITSLVSKTLTSYKDLPIRLYQISRKYRDELRPRHGLLRSREFTMKDLYTFDCSISQALSTYKEVRGAYCRLFDELKLPYLVAEASSGDMGGEDHVISCNSCSYVANEELADGPVLRSERPVVPIEPTAEIWSWKAISKDRSKLFIIRYLPSNVLTSGESSVEISERQVNIHAVKAAFPEIDVTVEDPIRLWRTSHSALVQEVTGPSTQPQIIQIMDSSVQHSLHYEAGLPLGDELLSLMRDFSQPCVPLVFKQHPMTGDKFNLLRVEQGDRCPRCPGGHLRVNKAIELGHTFHLGSRYTKYLGGRVTVPNEVIHDQWVDFELLPNEKETGSDRQAVVQMGCHGIGVSRIIGAVADTLADEKGLNWPRAMAPFEAIIVANKGLEDAAFEVYDTISRVQQSPEEAAIDLILDDRTKSFPWKLNDADLVGYPVIIVLGRGWAKGRMCEVQCRRLNSKKDVQFEGLQNYVRSLLNEL